MIDISEIKTRRPGRRNIVMSSLDGQNNGGMGMAALNSKRSNNSNERRKRSPI